MSTFIDAKFSVLTDETVEYGFSILVLKITHALPTLDLTRLLNKSSSNKV